MDVSKLSPIVQPTFINKALCVRARLLCGRVPAFSLVKRCFLYFSCLPLLVHTRSHPIMTIMAKMATIFFA